MHYCNDVGFIQYFYVDTFVRNINISNFLSLIEKMLSSHVANGKANCVIKQTDTSSNDSTSNSNSKEHNEADTEESDEITQIGVVGPTTRRAWSDWCSSRGKSSKENSDDDAAVITTSAAAPSQRTQRSNSHGRGRRGKKKVLRKKMVRKKVRCAVADFFLSFIHYHKRGSFVIQVVPYIRLVEPCNFTFSVYVLNLLKKFFPPLFNIILNSFLDFVLGSNQAATGACERERKGKSGERKGAS